MAASICLAFFASAALQSSSPELSRIARGSYIPRTSWLHILRIEVVYRRDPRDRPGREIRSSGSRSPATCRECAWRSSTLQQILQYQAIPFSGGYLLAYYISAHLADAHVLPPPQPVSLDRVSCGGGGADLPSLQQQAGDSVLSRRLEILWNTWPVPRNETGNPVRTDSLRMAPYESVSSALVNRTAGAKMV